MKFAERTVGVFQENAYLVVDETTKHAVLIDPGAEPDQIVSMVRDSGATLDAIWLTHAHLDHIGAVAAVRRKWKVPVHLHPDDLPLFERATGQAAFYGLPFEQPENPDVALSDGDLLSVGSLRFEVLHTPGHSPGHVVFKHDGQLFGGDLLFAGSIGRTDLPLSNQRSMESSLARICELDDSTVVHPGHGPSVTVGHERATNPFLGGLAVSPRAVKR
jgi:glyoxylase-like metal-dependent hydrolase (beta-lactamase superfamily II)